MTYQELQTELASQIADSSDSSKSLIFIFIKDVCRFLSTQKGRFLETSDNVTLTKNIFTYDLPSDFAGLYHPNQAFYIVKDNSYYPLEKISDERFFKGFSSTSTGMPTQFRLFGDTYSLKPVPDEAYTLYREYLATITTPVLTADVAIPDKYLQVIKSKVLILASIYQEQSDKGAAFGQLYQEVVNQISADAFKEDYPERVVSKENDEEDILGDIYKD